MRRGLAWCAAILFLLLGLYGATLGYGTDRDSLRVLQSAHAILGGHYLRSRSWGFPLHEASAAVLASCGGVTAVNLGSLAAACASIAIAARLLPPHRRIIGAASLAFCPLVLVNASSAIDFDWDVCAGMAVLASAARMVSGRGGRATLAGFAAASLALLLLRPDNVLFLGAITLSAGLERRRAAPGLFAGATISGLAAAAIYLGLNGPAMLLSGVSTTRPWAARLLRAGLFLTAALGPGGALALACLRPGAGLLPRATWLAWLFYLPRFAALPDQMDYLILPVTLTIVAAFATAPEFYLRPVAMAVALPSALTLSFIARSPETGAARLSVQPQWGALVQDFAARRFAAALDTPAVTARIQAHIPAPGIRHDVFLPAYVSSERDLVIGRAHLYRVVALGGGSSARATVPRQAYGHIYVCDGVLGPGSGWRAWEPPQDQLSDPIRCDVDLAY